MHNRNDRRLVHILVNLDCARSVDFKSDNLRTVAVFRRFRLAYIALRCSVEFLCRRPCENTLGFVSGVDFFASCKFDEFGTVFADEFQACYGVIRTLCITQLPQ